jgi:uncharacterized membrane protein
MFCRNCGEEVAQNAGVCLSCGVRPANGANFCNNCGVGTNPNQEMCIKCGVRLARGFGASVDEGKVWCILAYLGVLCFVPLLTQKQNRFIMFHARQGLALFIVEVAAWVLRMFFWHVAYIGWIFSLALNAAGIACFVLSIVGIVQALQGKEWKMPILGDFAGTLNF